MQPRWRNDYELLAAVAATIHAGRAQRYPTMVLRDELSQDEADRGIRVMAAIAADWRACAVFEAAPDWLDDPARGGAHPFERVNELAAAARRARAAADDPHDFEKVGFADAIDTLIWWETATPSARWLIDTTIALRAREAARHADRVAARPIQSPLFNLGVAA